MRRTEALAIPMAVKKAVAIRDSCGGWPCCVVCGRPAPALTAWSNAHYIARSQGGLGVEKNIVTLCPGCHRDYDQSAQRGVLRVHIRAYLETVYEDWTEDELTYRREL